MSESDDRAVEEERRTSAVKTLRLRDISPALTVDDLQTSLAWYRDVLGFFVKQEWERDGVVAGVSLVAGSESILLAQDDWAKGRDRTKGEGLRLYLTTAEDIDELAALVEERGGKLESPPTDMPWGARTFDLVDPDGYKLTVSSAE